MIRTFTFALLILTTFIICCNSAGKKAELPSIDYSITGTWGDSYSLKLAPSGHYVVKTIFRDNDSVVYFQGDVTDSIRTALMELADTIRHNDYNSLYIHLVLDGAGWRTILTTGGKKYNVCIGGYSHTCFDMFPGLAWAIVHSKSNVLTDTTVEFESAIPSLGQMVLLCDSEEARQMEAEAEKQAHNGKYTYTLRETIDSRSSLKLYSDYVKSKYGIKIHNREVNEVFHPSAKNCFYRRASDIVLERFGDDFERRTKQEVQSLIDKGQTGN